MAAVIKKEELALTPGASTISRRFWKSLKSFAEYCDALQPNSLMRRNTPSDGCRGYNPSRFGR